ncbi:MAG: bifunctional demethylmenaquinone methyltransferase/2-methoxy-6-polyprenyl-1,4-benzoquinol methylase UbiE [Alphaproteobacteria bacterium]|nr:bifunctional demethylmenaquinone methyltransferase/2-methoxy-6-polyprenyl-1,4-benzoquinol methylase UbiE [Alphaproteobacteria bacterium]
MPAPNPESEWFGFRRVDPEEKTGLVHRVFSSVAGRYDLMNDLMSGGLHRLWKDSLVCRMNPKAGMTLLDVAGGTGDIALRLQKRMEGKARIIVCDINPAMLAQGKAKAIDHGILSGIDWVTGNAEALPFPDRSVDMYSIAFGLRNVTRIDQALREAARVLKPGGRFFCMEFSPGVIPALKPLYETYCVNVLPLLGEFVAKDREAYQYLAESILKFPAQQELAKRMEKAGLSQVKWTNLSGGIAVIHEGWRL